MIRDNEIINVKSLNPSIGKVKKQKDVLIHLSVLDDAPRLFSAKWLKRDEYKYDKEQELFKINMPLHFSRIDNETLPTGTYIVKTNFNRNVIENIFINEISPSRTEIRIGIDDEQNIDWSNWVSEPSLFYGDFDRVIYIEGNKYRIINAIPDFEKSSPELEEISVLENNYRKELSVIDVKIETFKRNISDAKHIETLSSKMNTTERAILDLQKRRDTVILSTTFIIKLDRPVKKNIKVPYANAYIATEVFLERIYEDVYIYSEDDDSTVLIQLTNDGKIDENVFGQGTSETGWLTYNDVMSTYSESILPSLSESKDFGVKNLNIDFSNFSNHVYFGRASGKFTNVFNKIIKIQNYTGLLTGLPTSSDAAATSQSYTEKLKDIIDNMTQYEKVVYTISSSYCWPKSENSGSDFNISYSSSEATAWFVSQSAVATVYDKNNFFSLVNNTPEVMIAEDTSKYLGSLLGAWGDFFDYIKGYIDQFRYLMTFDYDWIDSVPRELLYAYSEMFGWELFEGYDTKDLPGYLLGKEQTSGSTALKAITQEKWLRLLSCIPYLNKIRGTRRSIDAILNIYGIPPSILSIKEYGGSVTSGSDYIEADKNVFALGFSGKEVLTVPTNAFSQLSGSDFTIELKFSTSASNDAVLFGHEGFNIKLENEGDSDVSGSLEFILSGSVLLTIGSGSDNIPYFNGDLWHNIILQRSSSVIFLKSKMFKDDQMFYNYVVSGSFPISSQSFIDSGSSSDLLYFASNTGSVGSYTGSMQEIRLWNKFLTEAELDQHTFDFRSIAMTEPFDVKNNLIAQYRLSDNVDLSSTTYVNDFSRGTKYDATASYFTTNTFVNVTKGIRTYFPNFTMEPRSDQKIRIGSGSQLNAQEQNSEVVDIFFSPSKAINEDILHDFAMYDFNNAIGNPTDLYAENYSVLDTWNKYYYTKFTNNFNVFAYIKFIRNFDNSIFKVVKTLLPERVRARTGLLISQPILERNKYEWQEPTITDGLQSGSIDDISTEVFSFIVDDEHKPKEQRINIDDEINVISNIKTNIIAQLYITGSLVADSFFLESTISPAPSESEGTKVALYSPLSSSYAASYFPVYEQLELVTYAGTINTAATDYNNAPVRVSESAGTIIRVK